MKAPTLGLKPRWQISSWMRRLQRGQVRQPGLPVSPAHAELLDAPAGTVDRHPGHDLGMGEVTTAPAYLPDAVVGVLPGPFQEIQNLQQHGPPSLALRQPQLPAGIQAGQHLTVDVQLELPRGGVADVDRSRALVAGQPVQLVFGQPPRPVDVVHDLQVRRVARGGPEQPVPEAAGLVDVSADHQRVQRQAGVAQPAVAVIPVANAPDRLGQRRGRGGDDGAGGLERQRLERDQRPQDGVAPRPLVAAAARPVFPVAIGLEQLPVGIGGRRGLLV